MNAINSFRLLNVSGNGTSAKYIPVSDNSIFALMRGSHVSALVIDTKSVVSASGIASEISLNPNGVSCATYVNTASVPYAKVKDGQDWRDRNETERADTLRKINTHVFGETAQPEVKVRNTRKPVIAEAAKAPETVVAQPQPVAKPERKPAPETAAKRAQEPVTTQPVRRLTGSRKPQPVQVAAETVPAPAIPAVPVIAPVNDMQSQLDAIAASVGALAGIVQTLAAKVA